jgi:hypothetical protein
MIASTECQFYCIDFWLPSDYQSEKDGESFVFASQGKDLCLAGFSLMNYCFYEWEKPIWRKYEILLKTLAFPLDFYGEEVDFLYKDSALALLSKISNRYAWEIACWLKNYVYPSWECYGKISAPRVTDSETLFR